MVGWPEIQAYVSLYFVLCPVYCNTVLANLNARSFIKGDDYATPDPSTSLNMAPVFRTNPVR